MQKTKNFLAASATLILLSTGANANLLVNGDFSQGPNVPPDGYATVVKGQTSIPAWNVERKSVDYNTTFFTEPPGAIASIDMNGTSVKGHENPNQPGILTQAFATTAGAAYQLSFYFSGNPACDAPPAKKTLVVEVGNTKSRFVWNVQKKRNTQYNMKWTLETVAFTATSASTLLKFVSTTKIGECGPVIGLVSVDPAAPARAEPTRNAGE